MSRADSIADAVALGQTQGWEPGEVVMLPTQHVTLRKPPGSAGEAPWLSSTLHQDKGKSPLLLPHPCCRARLLVGPMACLSTWPTAMYVGSTRGTKGLNLA